MTLNYDWSANPIVIKFLNKIYKNTQNAMIEKHYSISYADEFVSALEDYLYYFKIHNYNINNIVYKLQNIEVIEFYDSLVIDKSADAEYLKFPPVINQYSRILINTDIERDKRLTASGRRRLYLYQGLTHSLISMMSPETLKFSKIYSNYLTASEASVEMIVLKGWSLIEDTLSQEIAEKITYFSLNKTRPKYRVGLENEVFPISGCKITSNLEMYRVFQSLVVAFGLTIDSVASLNDYSERTVMEDLIKYAVNGNLSDLIIAEYNEKKNHIELYRLLYLMGLMVNEMYRKYHMNFIRNFTLSEKDYDKIYENILVITNRLISFGESNYKNANISDVVYDKKTEENVLKLVRTHEV